MTAAPPPAASAARAASAVRDLRMDAGPAEAPGTPGLDAPGTGTGTLVEEDLDARQDYRFDEGDHERFAHYAPKDKILEAMVSGTPIRALCGKVWVPSRDPGRFPVCPTCKEIWEGLPAGKGGDSGGDGGDGGGR